MTHGTILLKERFQGRDHRLLLQTPNDGHTEEALWMLITLPERVAQARSWVTESVVRSIRETPTLKAARRQFHDDVRAFMFFEWYILDIGSLIALSYAPNRRWRVVPPAFYKTLASWDRGEPRIQVRIKNDALYVRVNRGMYPEILDARFFSQQKDSPELTVRQFIEHRNQDRPRSCHVRIRPKGLFIPLNNILLHEHWRLAQEEVSR